MKDFTFVLHDYNEGNILKKYFKDININWIRKNRLKANFDNKNQHLGIATLKKLCIKILNVFNNYLTSKKKFILNILKKGTDYFDFELNNKIPPKIYNNHFRITGGFL